MKKKFLACTLAALMCLQPASAVLAEDLDLEKTPPESPRNPISSQKKTPKIFLTL